MKTDDFTGQARTVVAHLNRGWALTKREAWERYGISHLGGVVHVLRKYAGLPIRTEWAKVPARAGRNGKAIVARYIMKRGAAS